MEDDVRERTPHRPKKISRYVEKNKYNDVHNRNHKSRISLLSSKKDIVRPSVLNKMYEMDGCEYRGNYNDIAMDRYSNKNDVNFQLTLRDRFLDQPFYSDILAAPIVMSMDDSRLTQSYNGSDSGLKWTKDAMSRIFEKSSQQLNTSKKPPTKLKNLKSYIDEIHEGSNLSIKLPPESKIKQALNDTQSILTDIQNSSDSIHSVSHISNTICPNCSIQHNSTFQNHSMKSNNNNNNSSFLNQVDTHSVDANRLFSSTMNNSLNTNPNSFTESSINPNKNLLPRNTTANTHSIIHNYNTENNNQPDSNDIVYGVLNKSNSILHSNESQQINITDTTTFQQIDVDESIRYKSRENPTLRDLFIDEMVVSIVKSLKDKSENEKRELIQSINDIYLDVDMKSKHYNINGKVKVVKLGVKYGTSNESISKLKIPHNSHGLCHLPSIGYSEIIMKRKIQKEGKQFVFIDSQFPSCFGCNSVEECTCKPLGIKEYVKQSLRGLPNAVKLMDETSDIEMKYIIRMHIKDIEDIKKEIILHIVN